MVHWNVADAVGVLVFLAVVIASMVRLDGVARVAVALLGVGIVAVWFVRFSMREPEGGRDGD